jgi:hypothetical protein
MRMIARLGELALQSGAAFIIGPGIVYFGATQPGTDPDRGSDPEFRTAA